MGSFRESIDWWNFERNVHIASKLDYRVCDVLQMLRPESEGKWLQAFLAVGNPTEDMTDEEIASAYDKYVADNWAEA